MGLVHQQRDTPTYRLNKQMMLAYDVCLSCVHNFMSIFMIMTSLKIKNPNSKKRWDNL